MIRGVLLLMLAVCALAVLVSCGTTSPAKTTAPAVAVNSNAAPTPEARPTWTATDLAAMLEDRKEMQRAWARFEQSQKYRLAQPGETQYSPFAIWSEAEAYQGDELLIAIVVGPARTDRNRYGLVVIGAPESDGGKYKPYWVLREQDLEKCEISGLSGSVFFDCVRADGTEKQRSLAWFRSRRQFELKNLNRYGVSGP
jgi:hypothetical protein